MPKPEKTKHEHESYGMLSINRSSQETRTSLFGSSIRHGHTVSLVLSRAVEYRSLSDSHYHATERLYEVVMSEAQFVRLITNMNTGGGVPVTISYDGEKLCEDPPVYSERQRIREELKDRVEGIVSGFNDDIAAIERLFTEKGSIGKGDRAEILKKLHSMQQQLRNNVPFIHEQFDEAVEETITTAMAEIEAHHREAATRLGLKALQEGTANLLPEDTES